MYFAERRQQLLIPVTDVTSTGVQFACLYGIASRCTIARSSRPLSLSGTRSSALNSASNFGISSYWIVSSPVSGTLETLLETHVVILRAPREFHLELITVEI